MGAEIDQPNLPNRPLEAGEGRLGLGDQLVALMHLGFQHLGAPAAVHHPGATTQLAVAHRADVVDLAFERHAVRRAIAQAVAGLAHGGVDQREQRAAVQLAVQVAQAVVHAQAEHRLAVADLVNLQAEQAAKGAGAAHRLDLNAHAYFLSCLALANSAAMAALAGAGFSSLAWRSLRGAFPRGLPAPPPRPSVLAPGVSLLRLDRPQPWPGVSPSLK